MEVKEIIELSKRPNLHEELLNSIVPEIIIPDKVKEALLVQLFGATEEELKVILLVDTGLQDEKIINYVKEILPNTEIWKNIEYNSTTLTIENKGTLIITKPVMGRFNPYIPLLLQTEYPSRFIPESDIILPIRDLPSIEKDEKTASIILKQEKLKTIISKEQLKEYIKYARENIKPQITKEAAEEIKKFYTELRNNTTVDEYDIKTVTITTRQLTAIIKIAEANAKTRLDNNINIEDAERAINLVKDYLFAFAVNPENGKIDIDRINTGMTLTLRNKMKKLIEEEIYKLEK